MLSKEIVCVQSSLANQITFAKTLTQQINNEPKHIKMEVPSLILHHCFDYDPKSLNFALLAGIVEKEDLIGFLEENPRNKNHYHEILRVESWKLEAYTSHYVDRVQEIAISSGFFEEVISREPLAVGRKKTKPRNFLNIVDIIASYADEFISAKSSIEIYYGDLVMVTQIYREILTLFDNSKVDPHTHFSTVSLIRRT